MNKLLSLLMIVVPFGIASGMEKSFPTFFFGNAGQVDSEIRFIVNTPELRAGFATNSVIFQIHGNRTTLRFAGASSRAGIDGAGKMPGSVNFLLGPDASQWKTALPVYQRVVYHDLYPGIELTYAAAGPRVKSEFLVAAHSDPNAIRLEYPDADRVAIDRNGALVVTTGDAELREQAPEIYQQSHGARVRVEGRYRLLDDHTAGFEIAAYDVSAPLIIDPVVTFATYLGGSGMGAINGIAVDGSQNVYLAGWTEALDFPIHGAMQASNNGGVDAFVAKLAANGTSLLYATYIGGSSADCAAAIAVDSLGQAYVTGYTTSTNFPVVAAASNALHGGRDAFALKLNAAGSQLLYSTYFGGSQWDSGTAIAVDASGNAYIAGDTQSSDLPVASAVQSSFGGQTDAFVAKFTTSGAKVFSTYLGGSAAEHAGAIAVDSTGAVYVAGGTNSTNFPVRNAMQATNGGGQDAFLTKISSSGASLVYSTYFGGSGSAFYPEQINGLAVDSTGAVYAAGVTNSANFPATSGAIRTVYNGMQDAFAAKFSAAGAIVYATFLGGTTSNWAAGIAIDGGGNAYAAGNTSSVDFPVVNGAQANFGGFYDAFIAEINPAGAAFLWSTYYGGSGSDVANAIALDAAGNVYAAGETSSSDFPLAAAWQSVYHGAPIGFVVAFGASLPAAVNVSPANAAVITTTSTSLNWSESGAASFDVYFGTSATPPYLATTSSTTYNPGTLTNGQTYYWQIVAKNGSNMMSSATWSFTVQTTTCSYSISPSSATAPAAGATGSVTVTAGAGCAWTAVSNQSWLTVTSGSSGSGSGTVGYAVSPNTGSGSQIGTLAVAGSTFTLTEGGSGSALLGIALTHTGSLAANQQGVQYAISVSNAAGSAASSGLVVVSEAPPSSVTIVSMSGTGWNCSTSTCTRNDALAGGSAYPVITVTANISSSAASPLTNAATVSGGGAPSANATDAATLTTAMQFFAVTPCRVVDTRVTQSKTGAFGPPSLIANAKRSFPVLSSGCGIPATAQAYSLNVTVIPSGPVGWLAIWPSTSNYPGASTLNDTDGSIVANASIVPAGTDSGGSITVMVGNATDLIIDINGYFAPAGSGLTFFPLTQCRVADTRASTGWSGADGMPSLVAAAYRNFPIAGNCSVPASASAFSLNFTVVPPGAMYYLSTWPAGQPYPNVSTLNAPDGNAISNSALVPSGSSGAITVSAGNNTDMMIDVNGYFGSGSGGLHFYPVTPCRLVDTRASQPKTGAFGPPSLAANSTRSFPLLSGGCNIPSTAQVYALNITVVPPGSLASLSLWPTGQSNPGLSMLTSSGGNVIAGADLLAAGAGGSISLVASSPTDLILDIFGYFAP